MMHNKAPINETFIAFALDFKNWKFGNNGMTWAIVLHCGCVAVLAYPPPETLGKCGKCKIVA